MASNIVSDLLKGATDIHVHAGPDIHPRKLDCIQLVEEAIEKGMGGLLLKDHNTSTNGRAYILNRLYPQFKVYGALACNPPIGGINPAAVEAAIRVGCSMIFMPTYSSKNHISKWANDPSLTRSPSSPEAGLSVLDEKGKLTKGACEVLRLVAENNVLLGTGHISAGETLTLLRGAREANAKRILVTHVSLRLVGMSVGEQIEAVRLGAFIEHSYVAASTYLPESERTSIEEIAYQIREIGYDHCVMSTDLGQQRNPSPVVGLETFIQEMLLGGFKEDEILKMVRENPNSLLRDDLC